MCLVVGDVALWASGVAAEEGKGKIVRVLATYVYLGTVEPIWLDRPDIEISEVVPFWRVQPMPLYWSAPASYAFPWAMMFSATLLVFACTEQWINVEQWWYGNPDGTKRPLHQSFVLLWLLAPISDLVETAFYLMFEEYSPHQYARQALALHRRGRLSMMVEKVLMILSWVVTFYMAEAVEARLGPLEDCQRSLESLPRTCLRWIGSWLGF
ncbi:hypothetical protein V8C35DRAFT_299194 [Trichoderma chlorosporum]